MRSRIATELNRLFSQGASSEHLAYTLQVLAQERQSAQIARDTIELVWTGAETQGSMSRDTSVVVQELFERAQTSVLIVSYALDSGKKAKAIFQGLAAKMDAREDFLTRMFVNVKRPYKNTTTSASLLRAFAEHFRHDIWPGHRLPEVYYDVRSLDISTYRNACLHAKCLAIDERELLITSANFTEAAHERNLEAGVLISDTVAVGALQFQFESLIAKGILQRLALG